MTYDYGDYTPEPPTAKALAIRDRLADELAVAPTGSAERWRAEDSLVLHMLTEGIPLEDFSTSSGRAFVVHTSIAKPKAKANREREAEQWLARQGGSARTRAHKLAERGGGLPPDLFEALKSSIHAEPA